MEPAKLPTAAEVARWPESERRKPARSDRHFLVLGLLAEQLESEIERTLGDRTGLRVLDIGCGNKPYLPLIVDRASSYFGVDAVEGPAVDAVGVAEALPCEDESFDVVFCTHGVFLYHPDPPTSDRDYWRWTHSGLLRIFRQSGEWGELSIQPQGNVVACLGYIVAQYVDELGQKVPVPLVGRLMLSAVNGFSAWLDGIFPPHARVPKGGSLSANYLVTGIKAGG